MKTSKITYALLSALMLAGAVVPSVSTFATTSLSTQRKFTNSIGSDINAEYSETNPNEIFIDSKLQAIVDPYVKVINNQFIIEDAASQVVSPTDMQLVRTHLTRINKVIEETGLTIDPDTRTYVITTLMMEKSLKKTLKYARRVFQ